MANADLTTGCRCKPVLATVSHTEAREAVPLGKQESVAFAPDHGDGDGRPASRVGAGRVSDVFPGGARISPLRVTWELRGVSGVSRETGEDQELSSGF
jgi:hypothetical protein